MVQNAGGQYYGSINPIGMTQNGRVIYQVIGGNGQEVGQMTIKKEDCDKFEKSYRSIIKTAPLMEQYTKTATPESVEKMQKKAKWITLGSTLIGGGAPLFFLKGPKLGKWWLQLPATIAGAIGGMVAGTALAGKFATPPGSMEFIKATQEIQKMDIQPYGQNVNVNM